jgi:hypothetical protein
MLLEELVPGFLHVEHCDMRVGKVGVVGLATISAHGWGLDLGSTGWGGYDVKSCGQWLGDGGGRLEKKNHTTM